MGNYNDNSELEDFNNCVQSLSDSDNDGGINFNISPIENNSVNTVNIIDNLNIPNVSNNMMDVNTSKIVRTQVQTKK